MDISDFNKMKHQNKKISMVTCYDSWSAKIIAHSHIDCVLVGDSLAMVMHGYPTTINATIDLMVLHTQAVSKSVGNKFLIGDMPFLTHRKGLEPIMDAVQALSQAGAQAIKIEGAEGHLDLVKHIVNSGVPVMGHLGLIPQSVNQLGGFKVQGRDKKAAAILLEHALHLEEAGCFAIVLECIPSELAYEVTDKLTIPTIGIGAGPHVSGQVLVLHDLLGFFPHKPKFLKTYLNGFELIQNALNTFDEEVKKEIYPTKEHSYH